MEGFLFIVYCFSVLMCFRIIWKGFTSLGHFLLVFFLIFCPIVNTLTLIVGFTAAIFNK